MLAIAPRTTRRFNPIAQVAAPPAPEPVVLSPVTRHSSPPPVAVTQSPPAPKAGGLKKISFGKVATKKADTKTDYPVFDDPTVGQQVAEIAARIKKRAGEIEALDGAQKTDKLELRMFGSPFYYQVNAGKHEAPSSISIPSAEGEVLLTFQNRYTKMTDESEAQLNELLGEDRVARYFKQSFTLKVVGEELPEDHAQAIVDEISAVLEKYRCLAALEVDAQIKPGPTFHAQRLIELSPEENLEIEQICPVITMVKTKGRGVN